MNSAVAGHSRRVALLAGSLAVALATAGLFTVSRGKWSDAIIDSGREWIVPNTLAGGGLLYRDVVYWFGPFTPYLHAVFFRLFGSSFQTLVLAGAAGAAGALWCLFLALRRVAGRVEAALWTSVAIPALVFMPNAGGAILGMGYRMWHAAAFSLLAITVASTGNRRASRLAGAGALAALAGLCRTEWGLAALSAAALVLALETGWRNRLRSLALFLVGFVIVFGGVWTFFLARVGCSVLVHDQPVFLFGIPEATRAHVGLAGLSAWKTGIWNLLYSGFVWFGVFLSVATVALRKGDSAGTRRRLGLLAAVLLAALICAAMGAIPGPVLFAAAPLVCLAALVQGWRGSPELKSRALAGFGWMGLVASHRRFFFIDDAPYVAPPLLVAFVCAAGLIHGAVEREPSPASRRKLEAGFSAVLVALVILAFAGRTISYKSDDRVEIPGTGGMLSERPEVARQIAELAAAVRRETRAGEGLVVFPEGEILNFLSGRPNPIRHKLYIPGYLTPDNEAEVVGELDRRPPGAVVLWPRFAGEYASGISARDPAGRLGHWLAENYRMAPFPLGTRERSRVIWGIRSRKENSPR